MTDDEFLRRLLWFDAEESLRDRFPGIGEFVDGIRGFAPGAKVRWVKNLQTGDEVGKQMEGRFVVASRVERVQTKKEHRDAEKKMIAALKKGRRPEAA